MAPKAKLIFFAHRSNGCASGADSHDPLQRTSRFRSVAMRNSSRMRIVAIGAGNVPRSRVDCIFFGSMRRTGLGNRMVADFLKIGANIPGAKLPATVTWQAILFGD
jgi:hypothetical protein